MVGFELIAHGASNPIFGLSELVLIGGLIMLSVGAYLLRKRVSGDDAKKLVWFMGVCVLIAFVYTSFLLLHLYRESTELPGDEYFPGLRHPPIPDHELQNE